MLSIKPRINVVATILAKNEDDIIGPMIEHTIEQGVSKIIFTDNDSCDRTKEIASSYPEVVEIIDEKENDHNQSKWVTRMARTACKLKPDWIIHLDADELWCGIQNLRKFDTAVVRCEEMYLHPPTPNDFSLENQRHYLDFDHIPIPQECKIAHRPIEDIELTHGNHGIKNDISYTSTRNVYRHHYPLRSYNQWKRKSTHGHKALMKRKSICKRWEKWSNLFDEWGDSDLYWNSFVATWEKSIHNKHMEHIDFLNLLSIWVEDEMMEYFKSNPDLVARIGEWPKN